MTDDLILIEDNPDLSNGASVAPHDLGAELALIGSMMLRWVTVDEAAMQLHPEDFYGPAHAHLFAVICDLRRRGEPFDATVVATEIDRLELPVPRHLTLTAIAEASASPRLLIAAVQRLSVARRMLVTASEIAILARTGLGPDELMTAARDLLADVDTRRTTTDEPGLSTVDEFLNSVTATPSPWVVPGLLRRGWRCLIVAPEGVGKSVASRQVAICAAQAVHPFTGYPSAVAARTLIVDLENPDDAIAETCRPITERARRDNTHYDEGRAWLWRRPDGINLRTRSDRAALEAVVAATQPDLVCIGPLYKAYRSTARESDELAAGEVQNVLDDLRVRHGFALLMEHHAPKGQGLSARELVPYGSSLWLRWPELGLKLMPGDGEDVSASSLLVGRFRRDRMTNSWPDRLDRGGTGAFPWVGYWRDGWATERAG